MFLWGGWFVLPNFFGISEQRLSPTDQLPDGTRVLATDAMAELSAENCFTRNTEYDASPPRWMKRQSSEPELQKEKPAHPFPDLETLPGLVKLEQVLSDKGSLRHHCAATRIARNWFLTANHCVRMRGTTGKVFDMIVIAAQEDVAQPEAVVVPVKFAVCHRAWFSETGKFDDDVALLFVEDVALLSETRIADLDTASRPIPVRYFSEAYFAGWSKNGNNHFLQGAPLDISELGETLVLADNHGQLSPCVGDSGGPLYVPYKGKPRLAGVLSSVTQDQCPPYDRAFYIRVRTFEHWISRVMRNCYQKGQFVCLGQATTENNS